MNNKGWKWAAVYLPFDGEFVLIARYSSNNRWEYQSARYYGDRWEDSAGNSLQDTGCLPMWWRCEPDAPE